MYRGTRTLNRSNRVSVSFPLDDGTPGQDPAVRRAQLAALCERYYPRVCDRVHHLLARDLRRGRPWLASLLSTGDIVHEVFLGVVRDFDGFRGESEEAFVAYLARLTRNRLVDTVRHHEAARRDQRRTERDADEPSAAQVSPGARLVAHEDVELLGRVLARLPERDRALLRGRLEDEEPFEALATTLGYASADSARKAFHSVQARVLALMEIARRGQA